MSLTKNIKQNSRILITGGYGFIGHHLVKKFLKMGHKVTVIDDLSTGSISNLQPHSNLRVHIASVLDKEAMCIAAENCDLAIHLASVVGMMAVTQDAKHSYNVSVNGTENLFNAMGDKPIVIFSSSAVYGITENEDLVESETINRQECMAYDGDIPGYAMGKMDMEALGIERFKSGLPTLIIRPFNIIGEGQLGTYGMVLPRFINKAIAGTPLTVYDDGLQSRCFSDVKTVLNVLLKLIDIDDVWHSKSNIFNLGCDKPITILKLAKLVKSHLSASGIHHEVPLSYVPYDKQFPGKKDVRKRVPNTEYIESFTGSITWPSTAEIIKNVADIALEINTEENIEVA